MKIKVSILDQEGDVVKDLSSPPSKPGINRVYWDLRYKASEQPKMRTKVLEHSHVEQISNPSWTQDECHERDECRKSHGGCHALPPSRRMMDE